jgi:hypothetical protein
VGVLPPGGDIASPRLLADAMPLTVTRSVCESICTTAMRSFTNCANSALTIGDSAMPSIEWGW